MKIWKNTKVEYKFAFLISMTLFSMVAFTCYYMDLASLTIWTTNIWDTLFDTGNIRKYYEFSGQNIYGLEHTMVGSDILIYIPWAIWNLPIWALQRFGDFEIVNHIGMLFYSKCFLILVLVGCLVMTAKIARFFTTDEKQIGWLLFMSGTSFFVLSNIGYAGQNDIMIIFFFLLGFYCYLKEKRFMFVLWVAISIACKPFFFFSYIALILLIEKKIHKIILYVCGGFSIYLLQKLPFLGAVDYKESLAYGPTAGVLDRMLESNLNLPPAGLSFFVLGILVIYIGAYLHGDKNDRGVYGIYFVLTPFIALFLFTKQEFYRPIYLMPFLYLLMITKPQFQRMNLLLETAASGSYLYYYMIQDSVFYNGHYIHLPYVGDEFLTLPQYFYTKSESFGFTAFTAILIVTIGMLLIINHPRFQSENGVLLMKEEKWLIVVRSLLFCIPFALAVILRIVPYT